MAGDGVFRIGTRGSPLALWQARTVRAALIAAHGLPEEAVEIVVIKTSGDMIQDRALSQAGGKGLFTKEIDAALLDGGVDLAVHSAKDMPTLFPDGIVIAGYLPREDVRDAFISTRARTLMELPQGAVVGSASLRRQALIRRLRPDIRTTLLRGNVETRLRKIAEGEFDATLLALAGLKRLGMADRVASVLDLDAFPPAVGQGAIAVTARDGDARTRAALQAIAHAETGIALAAERAFLTVLDGSCRTPIAGHAVVEGGVVRFRGLVLRADGSESFEAAREGAPEDAARLGGEAGRDILARAPSDILAH
ncbi:hydroxymethylbilane synthase [Alsobacter sp. SYSU M60028]|uniref:Porphobilinogen deaminase n=1 Tax=Alsobacter ponti TaxID=2962936 RepID=A0ABT1LBC8_9HYPH|nr:hydroxymethylbilane synthase [Alsobacter ponti]MCP8938739.1 hydroxymethylbilane synthase [Alsobacter ponti]